MPSGIALAQGETTLKVLSFNMWGAGLKAGQSLDEIIAVLRATHADVIGLQEAYRPNQTCITESCADNNPSLACAMALALRFHCHDQKATPLLNGVNAVISRYPITGASESGLAVEMDVAGHRVTLFNLHLADAPYQPYQLAGIPYGDDPAIHTEAEAVAAATAARGPVIDQLERDLAALDGTVLITGDFNEPSFRDWTVRAANMERNPLPVAFPTTLRLEGLGFTDAYRAIFPDETTHPGFTWTTRPGAREHADRIDFIFARGADVSIEAAAVVGEQASAADVVVTPWPSDHRAVLATVLIRRKPEQQLSSQLAARNAHDRRDRIR
ncbi:MAG: endonuclease/exonuclease/phosphatase family protein [Beijerinckiaceae bacterium]